MASRPGLWCLIGVIMFPGFKAYEKTEQPILWKGLLGDSGEFQFVQCSLRTTDSFAGMTLYDVRRETDVYVSINSKNECKTKYLLGQCEFDKSSVSLKAVISNLTRDEIRTFACNSTWLEPEQLQGHLLINVSYVADKSFSNGVCSICVLAASIICIVLLVAAVSGWVAFYRSRRGLSCQICCCTSSTGKRRQEKDTRDEEDTTPLAKVKKKSSSKETKARSSGNSGKEQSDEHGTREEGKFLPTGKEDSVQKTIEKELTEKGVSVAESPPQPQLLLPHPPEHFPPRHTYVK